MLLSQLFANIKHTRYGDDVNINSLQYNSRKVEKGDLFCCIVGTVADGHKYAKQAEQQGAAALLVERVIDDVNIPQIVVKDSRKAMALAASEFYGNPSKEMTMVGITGTNGKTSTTYMLKAIAEAAGKKVGLIGTIRNMIGDEIIDTERTTPESVDLHRILRLMKDEGVDIVVMEVSSHSLDQKRVYGIEFDVAEFTNLTQDHLDYHKTFERYLAAKKLLFKVCKAAVINKDDVNAGAISEGLEVPIMTFGVCEKSNVYATEIEITTSGVQFDMHTQKGNAHMSISTPGLFSVFNALGSAAVALILGFDMDEIKIGLEGMASVSGRLEPLDTGNRGFSVLLDYAHTPDALENVIKTVSEFAKGRVVTLFGCGGDRDQAKRPIMGEIAGRYSDFVIVTSDNPRSEEPMAIINEIVEGVKKSACEYAVIENRREAIAFALASAQKDDVIILAGKGHENYQEMGGGKYHFDEKEIVAELLAQ